MNERLARRPRIGKAHRAGQVDLVGPGDFPVGVVWMLAAVGVNVVGLGAHRIEAAVQLPVGVVIEGLDVIPGTAGTELVANLFGQDVPQPIDPVERPGCTPVGHDHLPGRLVQIFLDRPQGAVTVMKGPSRRHLTGRLWIAKGEG